jgi:sec-independent protein translocase protein TatC
MVTSIRNWTSRLPRLPEDDPDEPEVFEEMTLGEHLLELRDRIVKIVIGVVLGFILGAILVPTVLQNITDAANLDDGLDIRSPADPVMIYFRIALYIAVGVTMPNIIYQVIAFLAPGLTRREKRVVFTSIPFMLLLFVAGVAYGYFFAIPRALDFLSGFLSDYIDFNIDATETVSFYVALLLGLGVSFQLPLIMFVVAKIGLATPRQMRRWRKYAILGIVIVAAIVTPTTDPINLALVALPLYALYEVGIVISLVFARTSLRSRLPETAKPASPGG